MFHTRYHSLICWCRFDPSWDAACERMLASPSWQREVWSLTACRCSWHAACRLHACCLLAQALSL